MMMIAMALLACSTPPTPEAAPAPAQAEVARAEPTPEVTAPEATAEAPPADTWTVTREDASAVVLSLPDGLDSIPFKRLGRALLHRTDAGTFDGYRLSGVMSGSLSDQLGLRNGDIVHAVNDMPLASVADAMAAYEVLSAAETMAFTLTRSGEPTTVMFTVQ